jgi:16S rRNA (guanine(1405)-N(7))-methyltransferase
MSQAANLDLDEIAAAVTANPRYMDISPELVQRIARQEAAKHSSFKDVVKNTRAKLHQVGGAYLAQEPPYERWLQQAQEAGLPGNSEALQQHCLQWMGQHASTRERLPILGQLYTAIFAELPPVHSVLDIACGLNPLAIPWMPLTSEDSYVAFDIYGRMVDFLNQLFAPGPLQFHAERRDVLGDLPYPQVDLALVLKTLPCLEQVDKQIAPRLLEAIPAAHLAVSFPVRSLGGRSKGMPEHYSQHFEALARQHAWQIRRLDLPGELVYLVEK